MSAQSPIAISTFESSPDLIAASSDGQCSPIIFSTAQEANGEVSPIYGAASLPQYPFCNCPVHDTRRCTGPADFPFCCEAHWVQESGNQDRSNTPDSLPSLVSVSDNGEDAMELSSGTDVDDSITSLQHLSNWISGIQVNTTRVVTSEELTEDQDPQYGITTEISADRQPIPVINISTPTKTYGKCWKCKVPNADHLRVNCPGIKKASEVRFDTPIPKTRGQRRADKKRPHKPTRSNQAARGRQSTRTVPEWRRRHSPQHRFNRNTLDTIKRNTGQDLIALLQEYSIKMGRANFDIWNMRRQFIEDLVDHISKESMESSDRMWGRDNNGWGHHGWGSTWA
jgi:hypothetical protein